MPDRRTLPSSDNLPDKHSLGRSTAGILSQAGYVALFVTLGIYALMASSIIIGFIATLLFVRFIFEMVPVERTEDVARAFRTGEAGEKAYDEAVERTDETTSRLRRLKRRFR